jgi:hypothetical protein
VKRGRPIAAAIITLSLVVGTSCDDHQSPQLDQRPFEGIREFDEFCRSIGGDTTDFVPRPIASVDTTVVPPVVGPPQNYSLVAACPNPTLGPTTVVQFVISQRDSVWLLVYDRTNSPPIDTLYARNSPPGAYGITWYNPGGDGILRVEMNTASGFRSHGDVLFTPLSKEGEPR